MAEVTEEMTRQRYEHKMESVTSDTKYFPSLGVGREIAYSESYGWELVSVVCEPGDADAGFCKALLFFRRPIAAPFSESAHKSQLALARLYPVA